MGVRHEARDTHCWNHLLASIHSIYENWRNVVKLVCAHLKRDDLGLWKLRTAAVVEGCSDQVLGVGGYWKLVAALPQVGGLVIREIAQRVHFFPTRTCRPVNGGRRTCGDVVVGHIRNAGRGVDECRGAAAVHRHKSCSHRRPYPNVEKVVQAFRNAQIDNVQWPTPFKACMRPCSS